MFEPGLLDRIAEFLRPQSPVQLAVGGDPAIHGVEPAESGIWMDIHPFAHESERLREARIRHYQSEFYDTGDTWTAIPPAKAAADHLRG